MDIQCTWSPSFCSFNSIISQHVQYTCMSHTLVGSVYSPPTIHRAGWWESIIHPAPIHSTSLVTRPLSHWSGKPCLLAIIFPMLVPCTVFFESRYTNVTCDVLLWFWDIYSLLMCLTTSSVYFILALPLFFMLVVVAVVSVLLAWLV